MVRERLVIFLPQCTVSPIIRTFTGLNFFVEVTKASINIKASFRKESTHGISEFILTHYDK